MRCVFKYGAVAGHNREMRVLVAGANGGLGPAVVQFFVQAGDAVAGVARSWSADPGGFQRIWADVSDPAQARRAIAEAGNPNVVVHVVGGFEGGAPVSETDETTWDRMFQVNVRSAVSMFRAALPGMMAARNGRLIAIGSRVAVEPAGGVAAYGASKAALVHLVRTLALELNGTGVTANVILPGTIDTAANRKAMPKANTSAWVKPEAIAAVAGWLASPPAADVNGAAIPMYGERK
jgi:NAD(P)-dependent dehydrogenase (short-subunit alcohol dehydrogenase family)